MTAKFKVEANLGSLLKQHARPQASVLPSSSMLPPPTPAINVGVVTPIPSTQCLLSLFYFYKLLTVDVFLI